MSQSDEPDIAKPASATPLSAQPIDYAGPAPTAPAIMIAHGQQVLDYAGPRAKGALRLPARTRLRITTLNDANGVVDYVKIVESLDVDKGPAVGAIAFAFVTMAALCASSSDQIGKLIDRPTLAHVPAVQLFMVALELSVIVMVVLNTWRKTTLTAGDYKLSIAVATPFSSGFRKIPARDVAELQVVIDPIPSANGPVGELRIFTTSNVEHRLFKGHFAATLHDVERAIRDVITV